MAEISLKTAGYVIDFRVSDTTHENPTYSMNTPIAPPTRIGPAAESFATPLHNTGFKSYDEEWAAFLAESSIRKTQSGINHEVPETLPRVWNHPRSTTSEPNRCSV